MITRLAKRLRIVGMRAMIFNSDELEQDIYEFDDVDQEIFQDPTLMIKWLKKQEGSDL